MTEEYNPDSAPYDPEDFSYGGGDYRSFDNINYEDNHAGGQDEGHNGHLDSHGQRQFSPSEYHDHDREDEFPFGSKLFIGNLASERTSKHELHKIFSVYGEIVDIMIKRSFGTVQFATAEACSDAIANENGRPIQGLRIDLRIFEPHRRPGRHDDRRGGHSFRRGGFEGPPFRGKGRGARGARGRARGGRARGRGRGFDQPPYFKDRYEDHNYDLKPFRGRGGPGRGRDNYRHRPYDREYDSRPYREDRPYGREPYRDEYDDPSHDNGYQHYPRQDPSYHSGYSDSPYNPQSRPPTGPAASVDPSNAHTEAVEEPEFLLPRRYGDQIPFCQIIVLDQIDRQFIWHVENSLRGSSISVDTLFISPKISLRSVIRQMILEGVHAVIFIEKQHQVMQKVSLQVFDQKSRVGDNVKFDAYDNVSVDEALAVMIRHKETLGGQVAPKNPPEVQPVSSHPAVDIIGQHPIPQPQQQQPAQPQNMTGNALLNPLLGAGGNIDFGAIASLLQTLQQQQQQLQQPQAQPQPQPQPTPLAPFSQNLAPGHSNNGSSQGVSLNIPPTSQPIVDPRLRGTPASGPAHSYEPHQASPYMTSNQPGHPVTSSSSVQSSNSITPFNAQSVLTTQQQSDPRLRNSGPNTSMRGQEQQHVSGSQNQPGQNNYHPTGLQSGVNRLGPSVSDPRLKNNVSGGPYRSQQMDNNREDYQRHGSGNGPAYVKESEPPSSVILSGTVTSSVSQPTVSAPVSNPPGSVNESVSELLSKLRELQNYQGGGMLSGSK